MRRLFGLAIAGFTAVGLAAGSVAAISSYNSEPAPERTEVGAFVALYDRDGDGTLDRFRWVCSGAMIDDDTFLTAAHCTADWYEGDRIFVSLEEDFQGLLDDYLELHPNASVQEQADAFLLAGWVVEGDPIGDPGFPGPANDTHDIGVIDFSNWATTPAEVWDFTPAILPTENQLSELGNRALDRADWWTVGYGTQEAMRGPGGHTHPGGGSRLKAPVDFNALTDAWVYLAMNKARDLGGACYGDSGGPNFVDLDGELILAGTTITGDSPCYATNVTYRTDTAAAREFLAPYVTLT